MRTEVPLAAVCKAAKSAAHASILSAAGFREGWGMFVVLDALGSVVRRDLQSYQSNAMRARMQVWHGRRACLCTLL